MSPSAEAQQLGYGHSPYQHPKGVPVSYPHSTPGYPYPTETLQQAYEGLDLTNSSLFPSSLHGPVPTSSVSSPSQGGQATRVDDSRSAVFGSPIPQSSHLMISRSPAAARSQPSHLLSSQSPVLQTPRSIHLLASQTALPVHTSNPQQIRTVKRPREESDPWDPSVGQRRRSRSGSVVPRMQSDLSEEEQLLLKLKHEDSLPWKDIAREFETRLNRTYQVPALQMRYKRLRERLRTWSDDDVCCVLPSLVILLVVTDSMLLQVQALKAAHEYWEKSKFEIISQKVVLEATLTSSPPKCMRLLLNDGNRCSSLGPRKNGQQDYVSASGKSYASHLQI